MNTQETKRSRSLEKIISTARLFISLVIVIVTFVVQFIFLFRAQQNLVATQQRLIAEDAGNSIVGFIQQKFDRLETAVRLINYETISTEELNKALIAVSEPDQAIRQLGLFDVQGNELTTTSPLLDTSSVNLRERAGSDFVTGVQENDRFVSSVYIDETNNEPLVMMAIPAIDVTGKIKGTLFAEVNIKFIWDLINRLEASKAETIYVVDKQGNLIVAGDSSRTIRGENLRDLDIVDELLHTPLVADDVVSRIFYRGNLASSVFGSYTLLSVPGWALVTEQPIVDALHPNIPSLLITVLILAVLLLVINRAGVFLKKIMVTPLAELSNTAAEIAKGDLTLRAKITGPMEIAQVATSLNEMTDKLGGVLENLERQVADRTRAIATSAEVSRRLSTILDQHQLVLTVVDEIQRAFNYYHAHIYVFDEQRENLVLVGGTGGVGQTLLEAGHKVPAKRGLVGLAADTKQVVLVPDTSQNKEWLPNPLLPDTKAEIAVPIALGEIVIGVLDIQHNIVNGLNQQDVDLLQSIANQVAVAIQNTRQYAMAQRQADREALINTIGQKIQQAQTFDAVLETAVRELGLALNVEKSGIQIVNPSSLAMQDATDLGGKNV